MASPKPTLVGPIVRCGKGRQGGGPLWRLRYLARALAALEVVQKPRPELLEAAKGLEGEERGAEEGARKGALKLLKRKVSFCL